ncbi:MAG: hypothetical protein RL685_7117 [Pseudomonadota bacterium]|jgi:RHS repeat-associated protein
MGRVVLASLVAMAACGGIGESLTDGRALDLDGVSGATLPDGEMTWSFEYDARGNLTRQVDPIGGETSHTYDTLQLRRSTVLPAPKPGEPRPAVLTDYDALAQESRVTDPRGLATEYVTDGLGRMGEIRSPDSGTSTATYDAFGNLETYTDARGKTSRYTYDALNRRTRIDYASGPPSTYEYDGGPRGAPNAIGHLTRINDESGTTSYVYDGFGRVIQKEQVVGAGDSARIFRVAYAWGSTGTATGKIIAVTYPSGVRVGIQYDGGGRPSHIAIQLAPADGEAPGNELPLLTQVRYTATHRLAGWTWGDGTQYQRGYDEFDRLTSYPLGDALGADAAAGMVRRLRYDNTGRITAYEHADGSGVALPELDQRFDYDGLGRLTSAIQRGVTTEYAYDATGNRTSSRLDGGSNSLAVESNSNRLQSRDLPASDASGAATLRLYRHDAAGHVVSDGLNTFLYSDRGRMSQAVTPNGTVEYLVNALEQRVRKSGPAAVVPTGAVYFAYDERGHLLGEYAADGTPRYETIYLRDTPIAVVRRAATSAEQTVRPELAYVYADQTDTPRVIARSADHAIVWRWDHAGAFGDSLPVQDPNGMGTYEFNQRFPGQVFEAETGLASNWHRDYSPRTGRYFQVDPLGLSAGINPYAYAAANPIQNIDPDGRFFIFLFGPSLATLTADVGALGLAWWATQSARPREAAPVFPSAANDEKFGDCPPPCDELRKGLDRAYNTMLWALINPDIPVAKKMALEFEFAKLRRDFEKICGPYAPPTAPPEPPPDVIHDFYGR